MGAGVRVGECGVDIIAAENWRCRWEKSCGVAVVVKCETVTAQTYVYQNKHGSFGRYDRRTSSAFPHPLCSWPQLYLLASALSIFSRLGVAFFTRWRLLYSSVYIPRIPVSSMSSEMSFLSPTALQIRDHTPSIM